MTKKRTGDASDESRRGWWCVREQIVHDMGSDLTIHFWVDESGRARLRLFGKDLKLGNREIGFDTQGLEAFAGASTVPCPAPSWIKGPRRQRPKP